MKQLQIYTGYITYPNGRKCPFGCNGYVTAVAVGQSQRLYLYSGSGVGTFNWYYVLSQFTGTVPPRSSGVHLERRGLMLYGVYAYGGHPGGRRAGGHPGVLYATLYILINKCVLTHGAWEREDTEGAPSGRQGKMHQHTTHPPLSISDRRDGDGRGKVVVVIYIYLYIYIYIIV